MASRKKQRFISLYFLSILFYAYNAVTVKKFGSIPLVEQGTNSNRNIRKRSLHLERREESIADTKRVDHHVVNNNFVSKFEEIITSTLYNKFAAIVLKQGKIYCRSSHKEKLLMSRGRYFVQMLQQGLRDQQPSASSLKYDLPILLKHDDSSGCHPATQTDAYLFPRLAWAVPLNSNITNQWCSAVGAPSYKAWRTLKEDGSWETMFRKNEKLYPWSKKINKAVWRGSTTSNRGMYGKLELQEIPRGMLVFNGINKSFMDVGFHKLVGKYERTIQHNHEIMKDPIPLEQMMKYKAIIDIDGNNWSARFNSLLCYNSVVIKVEPAFVESNFQELVSGVHYLPATLNNISQVAEFIMDGDNDADMQQIVANANAWCKENMIREKMATSAIKAIEEYHVLLNGYDEHWHEEWHSSKVLRGIDDLVECDV